MWLARSLVQCLRMLWRVNGSPQAKHFETQKHLLWVFMRVTTPLRFDPKSDPRTAPRERRLASSRRGRTGARGRPREVRGGMGWVLGMYTVLLPVGASAGGRQSSQSRRPEVHASACSQHALCMHASGSTRDRDFGVSAGCLYLMTVLPNC